MRTPKFSHCILSLVSLMAHVLFSLLCALLLVPPPSPHKAESALSLVFLT